ncbi:hypothetical protein BGW36DRAFT_404806, partial [Talaromyces proteolyticus]
MSIMEHDRVTVAVIGAGTIGRTHALLIAQSQEATLSAIVDPTDSGKQLAETYNTEFFKDIEELLHSYPLPKAAIICTPNTTHISIAERLAAVGIHQLIEKPISPTYHEGQDFLQIARDKDIRICVGHHRRFHASISAAKESVASGSIGRVIGISGVWTALKPPGYFEGGGDWRTGVTGGVILINLIHEIDLLQYFMGPIQRVYAEKAPSTRGYEAEEGVAVTFRFQSGVVGTFLALDNAASPFNIEGCTGENRNLYPYTGQDCYRIFGTKGTLSIPDNTLWTYKEPEKGRHSEMQQTALVFQDRDVYANQLDNFIAVVRGTQDPVCSGEAGLSAVAVCESIKQSLQTGLAVDVLGNF